MNIIGRKVKTYFNQYGIVRVFSITYRTAYLIRHSLGDVVLYDFKLIVQNI